MISRKKSIPFINGPKSLRSSRSRHVSASRRGAESVSAIMLFGRKDEPTDAVRDYANYLSAALRARAAVCENWEMRWHEQGWFPALSKLWIASRNWRGRWAVLHYTALMWSRRGFPAALPLIVKMLKLRGCRVAVVFHDVHAVAGSRWVDQLRVSLQERIMRHLSGRADRAIITIPAENVPWLTVPQPGTEFIPVGANVSSLDELAQEGFIAVRNAIPTVAVFGIPTWPAAQKREVEAIVRSVRKASARAGELQLLVMGRGAKQAESLLRTGLAGSQVHLTVDGLRSSREIGTTLSSCDALLFVRGALSSRRGSGVAAIACGLPIVAYQGRETGYPLNEAGIIFVPQGDADALGNELARILLDSRLRLILSERNLKVFREWFSWERIAERWVEALGQSMQDLPSVPNPKKIADL
jgi:glycosyltransferase involved in cell wall biosynthesis